MAKKATKQSITVAGSVLTVAYPTIKKSLMIDASKLTPEVQHDAMMHGLAQKLGDAKSGGTAAEKYDMASRIVESLEAGSWTLTSRADDSALVVEAVARIKGETVETIEEVVEAAGEDGPSLVKTWRTNGKVAAEIAKIKAERLEAVAATSEELEIPGLD